MISIINSCLPKEKKNNSDDLVTLEAKEIYLNNESTKIYLKISEEVKKRTKYYYSLDLSSDEANKARKSMFDALNARRNFLTSIFENNSDKLNEISQKLGFVEASERKAFSIKKEVKEDKILSKEHYISSIKDLLIKLNEAHFKDNKNNVISIFEEYDSLFNSLFSEEENKRKYEDLSKDIVNLLIAYNLNGGYDRFKSYYSNGKMGNKAISKNLYEQGVESVKSKIEKLIGYASEILQKKGNQVKITYSSKSLEEELKDINISDYRICDEILQMQQAFVQRR